MRSTMLMRRAPRRRVRAVTLDCWGTLFLDGPATDDRYMRRRLVGIGAALTSAGIQVSLDDLRAAYDGAGRWLGQLWRENRDVSAREHVVKLVDLLGSDLAARVPPETIATLIREYASPALIVPPAIDPGARVALGALASQGVALAMVSNTMRTPGRAVREILDQSDLLSLFQVLTFSDECRIRKPDRGIFLRTLRDIDVPAEDAVHVGDDAILDVKGARDAGMRAIQVTPDGRAAGPARPDAVIRHLGQLPLALARLER